MSKYPLIREENNTDRPVNEQESGEFDYTNNFEEEKFHFAMKKVPNLDLQNNIFI